VQAAWAARRCRRQDPLHHWASAVKQKGSHLQRPILQEMGRPGLPVGRLEDHFWIRDRKARLSFYINRGRSGLSVTQRQTLEAAKGELRKLFGKDKTTRTA
jgi:hypothetical protein